MGRASVRLLTRFEAFIVPTWSVFLMSNYEGGPSEIIGKSIKYVKTSQLVFLMLSLTLLVSGQHVPASGCGGPCVVTLSLVFSFGVFLVADVTCSSKIGKFGGR